MAYRGPHLVLVVHHQGAADSYRAELVRTARKGLEFGRATGEPLVWAAATPR